MRKPIMNPLRLLRRTPQKYIIVISPARYHVTARRPRQTSNSLGVETPPSLGNHGGVLRCGIVYAHVPNVGSGELRSVGRERDGMDWFQVSSLDHVRFFQWIGRRTSYIVDVNVAILSTHKQHGVILRKTYRRGSVRKTNQFRYNLFVSHQHQTFYGHDDDEGCPAGHCIGLSLHLQFVVADPSMRSTNVIIPSGAVESATAIVGSGESERRDGSPGMDPAGNIRIVLVGIRDSSPSFAGGSVPLDDDAVRIGRVECVAPRRTEGHCRNGRLMSGDNHWFVHTACGRFKTQ
mmetsp:Transcript_11295/g.20724  ORF Transcript_11295/g.20724 Transcript_11295/m.20724 type:complete len:291 (+) Transcript_11295:182-1054(+)